MKKYFLFSFLAMFLLVGFLFTNTAKAGPVGPDLTATITNSLGGGSAELGVPFTWTIRVENVGNADAVFPVTAKLFGFQYLDNKGFTYISQSVTTSNITGGEIACSTNTNVQCTATSTVTMPAGSYFDLALEIKPSIDTSTTPPSLKSPITFPNKLANKCMADPNISTDLPSGIVIESSEGNNACNVDSVNVLDTTAPTLSLPSDITTEATSGAGAIVTYSATATDLYPTDPVVTCDILSGSTFGLGDTTVNCSVSDTVGNTSNGSFKVTVVDTTAPVISLLGDNPVTVILGDTYTDAGATALDAVDGTFSATASGSVNTAVIGIYTITYNATDIAGNVATPVTRTVNIVAVLNQLAPEGLVGVAPTSVLNDGKITGTTIAMEYKLSSDTEYTPATDTEITGLVAGTYDVRLKAKEGFNVGASATVIVPAYAAPVVHRTSGGGGSSSSTTPQTDQGCLAGNLFSITTGNPCPTTGQVLGVSTQIDEGCIIGNVFSTKTGNRCLAWISGKVLGDSTYTFTLTLKYKMQGDDVKALQVYLNTHGYPIATTEAGSLGNETNYFGSLTKAAVIKFQLANKLVGDGVVGPLTRALLNK